MTVLSILLFSIGVVFLIWGWRWQNPPCNELLTALRGIAHLKSELNRLEKDLKYLNQKLGYQTQALTVENSECHRIETSIVVKENIKNEDNRNTLPEKYHQVLELATYDFTVPEISERLEISQDAVMMVIQTYQKGGKT